MKILAVPLRRFPFRHGTRAFDSPHPRLRSSFKSVPVQLSLPVPFPHIYEYYSSPTEGALVERDGDKDKNGLIDCGEADQRHVQNAKSDNRGRGNIEEEARGSVALSVARGEGHE